MKNEKIFEGLIEYFEQKCPMEIIEKRCRHGLTAIAKHSLNTAELSCRDMHNLANALGNLSDLIDILCHIEFKGDPK